MVILEIRDDGSVRRVIRAPDRPSETRSLDLYRQLTPQIDRLERDAKRAAGSPTDGRDAAPERVA
jgi:hypothetical protein